MISLTAIVQVGVFEVGGTPHPQLARVVSENLNLS